MAGRKRKLMIGSRFTLPCLMLIFTACRDHRHPDKAIFRYNEPAGISSLDPAFARNQANMWPVHQLYSTLTETDDSLRVRPGLATRWEFSSDKRQVRFTLRSDVMFHDDPCFAGGKGRTVLASDVAFSFSRLIDPGLASPGAWIFNDRIAADSPFVALNDSTFELRLREPFVPVLGMLSMQYCSVVPREAVEKYGPAFRSRPVGSGPFRFVAWDEGVSLILKRNEKYFERDKQGNSLPYLDGIAVAFNSSKASEFLSFRQNKLDFVNDIDPAFKDEILSKTGVLKKEMQPFADLSSTYYLNTEYLGFLLDSNAAILKNAPVKQKLIRQAINYAIDRQKLLLYMRNSMGTAATSGFIPQGLPSFSKKTVPGYDYDPARSAKLLADAGFPQGRGLPEITLLTVPAYANIAAFIVSDLRKLGIPVQAEVIQKSLLLDKTSKSLAPFFRGSWIADYPDAENYLSVFYSKNPAPPNYTRYSNPAFDRLYEIAVKTQDDSSRYALYRAMDMLILEDAAIVPLWYDKVIRLVQKNIRNFAPNPLNMLELRRVMKTK